MALKYDNTLYTTSPVIHKVLFKNLSSVSHITKLLITLCVCVSSMGYCVLVVHGLNRLYSVVSRWGAAALTVSMLVVLLLFSWKTVQQNEIWLSREALFRCVHIQFLLKDPQ